MLQPAPGSPHDRTAVPGEQPLQLGSVPILGRPEQPVGAAYRLGQRQRPGDFLRAAHVWAGGAAPRLSYAEPVPRAAAVPGAGSGSKVL